MYTLYVNHRQMLKKLLLFTFISFAICAKAQNPAILTAFELNRFQNEIIVSWEIQSGSLCSGLQVEHSTDSINFTSIYDYPGVCGSSTASERYTFSHIDPAVNKKNYYRINLNTNGISEILSITFIKLEESGYALFPMPLEPSSKIYFSNDNNETAAIVLYNSSGAIVYQSEPLKTNEFNLGNLQLPLGLYHFSIVMADRKNVDGKFVVAK